MYNSAFSSLKAKSLSTLNKNNKAIEIADPLNNKPKTKETIVSFLIIECKMKYKTHAAIPMNMLKARRFTNEAFSVKSNCKGEYLKLLSNKTKRDNDKVL